MTLFVDASAAVAMIANEPEARDFANLLDHHDILLWSPVVQWETTAAVSRLIKPAETAPVRVREFGHLYGLRSVAIDETIAEAAIDAFVRFGKRSGHSAQLNMGDCFAYACAKANEAKLLYKGDDFRKTDLA